MTALPERWEDEPWPLDDPVPTSGLRPVNWSDTHTDPPQVADLADEAWEYAIDHGISMERALAELQRRQVSGTSTYQFATGGIVKGSYTVTVTADQLRDAQSYDQFMDDAWRRAKNTLTTGNPAVSVGRLNADALLDDIKRGPFPRRTLDQWSFSTDAHKTLPPDPGSTP